MSEIRGGVSDDPGRIIYELEEKLKTANAKISYQTAENDRLQADWQSQSTTAQQLRSDGDRLRSEVERLQAEVDRLEGLNYKLSEALRDLQEDHTAMDHRAEGARLAFLDVIKTLLEMRR